MNPRFVARAALTLLSLGVWGCERTAPSSDKASAPAASVGTTSDKASESDVLIRSVPASSEAVASIVARERAQAAAAGRTLLVYVGASWCEPCVRFHRAAEAGLLRGVLPPITLLEFDKDRDDDRLRAAGYTSRLIPLFAVPGPDGTASGKQMEGSIKGDGAVAEITPRLRRLVDAGER